MQNFQGFHQVLNDEADLFHCKQKDKEPLASYIRRFIKLRSQTPHVAESVAISACIAGLNPRPTASKLTRKKPKTMEALFAELDKYIRLDENHRRRVAERNNQRQAERGRNWQASPYTHNQNRNQHQANHVLAIRENQHQQGSSRSNNQQRYEQVHSNFSNGHRGGHAERGGGRNNGPPKPANQPRQPRPYYCTFHGKQHHHGTDWCPLSLEAKAKKEAEEKAAEEAAKSAAQAPKTIHHTTFYPHSQYYPSSTGFAPFQLAMPWHPSVQFQPQTQTQTTTFAPQQPRHDIPLPPPNIPNEVPKAEPNPPSNTSNAISTYGMIMPISGGSSHSEPRESNPNPIPTLGMIMLIVGGSTLEFENKRQKRNYFREVNTIIPDGPPRSQNGHTCQSLSRKMISG